MGGTTQTHSARLVFVVACFLSLPLPSFQQYTYTSPRAPLHIYVPEDAPKGSVVANITDDDPRGPGRIGNVVYLGSHHEFYTAKIQGQQRWGVYLNVTLDYDRGAREIKPQFRATGTSSNVASSDVTISLHVGDVNDVYPEFKDLPYNAEVNEDAASGTVVYSLISAEDIDTGLGGTVKYFLEPVVQGNAGAGQGNFTIDRNTGAVTLLGTLDYESRTFYHYTVTAKDQGTPSLNSTTDLFVTVKDVQDSPPVFTNSPYVLSVDEDARRTQTVLQVKAEDQDRAIPNQLAYNITRSTCPGSFQIDTRSGVITVAGSLDRDTSTIKRNNGVCTITVQATEVTGSYPQKGNFTAVAKVTININDINDNAPAFTSGTNFSATMNENSPAGTRLRLDNNATIIVQDIDQGSNSEISLSLATGGDTFELVSPLIPSSGSVQLRVKNSAKLNFEASESLLVKITARDAAHRAVTATVTVQLINVNEFSPAFVRREYQGTVPEGSPPGTPVVTVNATDADAHKLGAVKYSLRNDGGIFQIDADSGAVTVASNDTDRERVDYYYMLVIATDGGSLTDAVSLTVIITDVNDERPVFQRDRYDAILDEDRVDFSRPVTIQATDGDEANTKNSNITYEILSAEPTGLDAHFRVDPITGQLTVTSALDFDTINFPQTSEGVVMLLVQASDDGSPHSLSTTATVAITLNDINDNSPSFQNTPYSTRIPEGSAKGEFVLQVSASDADGSKPNNDITYSIESGGQDRFRINPGNGTITVSSAVDREQAQNYTLIVVARDKAASPKSVSSEVAIIITDVNDEAPTFGSKADIRCDQPELFDGVLCNMTATDLDTDSELKYSIVYDKSSGQSGKSAPLTSQQIQSWVSINSGTGEISTNRPLDILKVQTLKLQVQVNDTKGTVNIPQLSSGTVTINVQDVDNHAPLFSVSSVIISVDENAADGIPFKMPQISVSDLDQGEKSEFTLRVSGISNQTVMVVPSSARGSTVIVLRVGSNNSPLDYENKTVLHFQLIAEGKMNSSMRSVCHVTLNINNVNDHLPQFPPGQSYRASINETSSNSTFVTKVTATDDDSGSLGEITYSVLGDNNLFRIDPDSGVIRTASKPSDYDREKTAEYFLTVMAEDGGGAAVTTTLKVTLMDVNDNRPVFVRQEYLAFLQENSHSFDSKVFVEAEDADEKDTVNSQITFGILQTPGTPSMNFSMNETSGQITIDSPLDFESLSEGRIVTLNITATDKGLPARTGYATVIVTVEDVNDNPPSFQNAQYAASIPEGSAQGEFVLQVRASDADGSKPNNNITYSIESGGQDRFRINPDNGTITVSSAVDREQTQNYTLIVVARDRAASPKSVSSEVAVVITDVNDEAPTFGSKANMRCDHPELFDGMLCSMAATDLDTDSELEYSIVYANSSGQSGKFASLTLQQIQSWVTINSSTGEIYTKKRLDILEVQTLKLQVKVIDTNGTVNTPQFATGTVTINVLDVDNHSPLFSVNSVNISVDENAANGIPFKMPQITVSDLDQGGKSEFSLRVSGISNQTVVVVPSSARGSTVVVLRVGSNNSPLDYENNTVLHFQLIAEGKVNSSMRSICHVTLNINNVNDHLPKFPAGQSYSASISENPLNRTFVTSISATDGDSGLLGEITYSILGNNSLFKIDPESGVIITASKPSDYDREKTAEYFLTVMAMDGGNATVTTAVQVTLTDINDNDPVFLRQEYSAFLKEDSWKFDSKVFVEAEDADEKNTVRSQITYGILQTPGSPSMNFSMNATSGQIIIDSPLDFESLPKGRIVTLNVTAADKGSPARTGYATVVVTVEDKNDNEPKFERPSYSGSITENEGPDVSVAQVHATDNDRNPPNNKVFYIIDSGGNDRFRVNSTTGEITTVVNLDREENSEYNLIVLAMDRGSPALTGTTTVSVFVKNINDDPPEFSPSQISASVTETPMNGSTVKILPVVDNDEDANLQYHIDWNVSKGYDTKQMLVTTDVLKQNFVMVPNQNIVTTSSNGLDREAVESASLVIVVIDANAANGTHQTATGTLSIQVQDADDNSPHISRNVFNASLTENSPRGTPLQLDYDMNVIDIDKDENSAFNLKLSKYTDCLEVIPPNGRSEVTVLIRVTNASCFDYEKMSFMEFEVVATGERNASRTSRASVNLNIANVNDVTPRFNQSSYRASVDENLNISTSVIRVQAFDLDEPPFNAFNYSMQGGDGVFSINENGEVTVAKDELDYENRKEYQMRVEATDEGDRRASVQLTVSVLDVNDETPKFSKLEYQAFAKEKDLHFVRGVIVEAKDNDGPGNNSEVYYSLPDSSKWSANFSINATSGQLLLKSPLDYEALGPDSDGIISVDILATDRGTPRRTGSVTVRVTVQDVNDCTPAFTNLSYSGTVQENKKGGTLITTVNATDPDGSAPNNDVFYLVSSGGNDQFRINSTSGDITTVQELDRESTPSYLLEVLAVDRGSPAQTSSVTVSISVINVNDDVPKFQQSDVTVTRMEGLSPGSLVFNFSAHDRDEDAELDYAILWNISYGHRDDQVTVNRTILENTFQINKTTGSVTVNNQLDREILDTATLFVFVKDLKAETHPQTATGTLSIQVTDADDNPPVFSRLHFNASISENSPEGIPVQFDFLMSLSDSDKGANSMFKLSLTKYTDCLKIIPSAARAQASVVIQVSNQTCFDYETQKSMDFEVVAMPNKNVSNERRASVRLHIINVNDNKPQFLQSSYAANVSENATDSTFVITVQATDQDEDPFNIVTYSLQGGDGRFVINKTTGEVVVGNNVPLDFETRKEYQLTVEATDKGKLRDSAQLTISLLDVNDNSPEFLRPEYQAFIKENDAVPDLIIVQATDKDDGINKEIRYSISPSSELADNFTINATSGHLGTSGSSGLDYESLPDTKTGVVNLTLSACDLGAPSLCSSVSLLVTVSDENDHAPQFSQLYNQDISEDAVFGASIITVSATDHDGKPPNNNVFYVMAGGGNDKFKVDSSTGLITVSGQLDSDTQNFYNLTINAIDGGSPAKNDTTFVTVSVTDVNDVVPTFEPQSKIISVNETREGVNDSGRALLTLWAKDTDVDSSLLYTMVWDDSRGFGPNQEPLETSVLKEAFQIHHSPDEIQVHSTLDRELLSRAVLIINVTDLNAANSSLQTSTGTLTVNVLDVNDHEPTFNMMHYTVEIQENSVKDSVLKMVAPEQMNVTDLDTDQNCVFNVSVIGPESASFKAEPSTARSFALVQLRVRNSSVLDYEQQQSINFTVKSMETDTKDHFSNTAFVTLNIIDVNDNDPEFENDTYYAFVPENSATGTSFLHIHADDKDSGSFGNVTYSLEGDSERFHIDEFTGELRTADGTLNREIKDTYLMTVVATDGGRRRSGATLQITVTDMNDETPSFQTNYSTSVLENKNTLSPPVILQAGDKDEKGSANSNLTYHLASCSPVECSNFSLDPIMGELTLDSLLDYEKTQNVILFVEARDQGLTVSLTGTAVVSIDVRDDNDVEPQFTQTSYSANVTENAAAGTNVTMVAAFDGDGKRPNNVVFYVLDSGRGSDKFRIDSTTGLITVGPGANLDRESENGIFSLTVLAIDRGDPPLSSSVTVSVSLLDENDELPVFAEVRKEVKVYENASNDYELAVMSATDEDANDDLEYTWVLDKSQATTDRDALVNISKVQDWFQVDPRTGRVTVKSELDREMAEVVSLRILVNDTNGVIKLPQTAWATLVITLRDVNDNAPVISGRSTLQVSESLAENTEVASFSAQDNDRDQDVTFSILNGTDGSSFFDISSAGTISLSQKIDREETPVVSFMVIATDNGNPSLSSNITVNVTVLDANDNDPRFDNTSYIFNVSEAARKGTTVTIVNATDDDLGRNAEVTFAFADNVLDFEINRTSGEITVKRALDRETMPTYNFGVVALDNPPTYDTRSVIQQVTIKVTDINDNSPVFTSIDLDRQQYYWAQTDETSLDGAPVLGMLPGAIGASDKDEGQNSNLSFYLTFRGNSSGLVDESSDQYLFRIDETTGKVFVNGSIEGKANVYNYTVMVMDHGEPSALSATANLTVVVKDKNINSPYFVNGFGNISVPECAKPGTTVTTFHAQDDDRDKETNGRVQYFLNDLIANSADHAYFRLDKDSGELISTKAFDSENQSVFHISVKAQDMGLPRPLSTVPTDVTINIDDGNDEPAVFRKSDYYFNITEEQIPSFVGTVFALDQDTFKRTCYSLNGELAKLFSITTPTDKEAELKLLKPLDRETEEQASFILDVIATDCTPSRGDGCPDKNFAPSRTKVHIRVLDINDNPPKFTRSQVTAGVTSTANTGFVIVDLQAYVTDRDLGKNRVHSFHPVGDYEMDKDLKNSFTPSDRPLTLSANGSVATFADLPRDAQGFFTWKIMANDSAGNDTVLLKIYVVGEDKLIRIIFSKSMEELRQTQDEILRDLKNNTGLEFVADDRVAFEDEKGVVDPFRSVLVVHAINKQNEVMLADALRDYMDHAIKVTTFMRSQHKLFGIETFKAATAQPVGETRAEYILGAIICVLVLAFLITLFLMINNIRRFKRKLKAATIETYPMSRQAKEAFPGIKTPQTNPIFGKDEAMEKDEYDNKRSNHVADDDSLDNNSVDIDAGPYRIDDEGDDEQEMTMDLYGEDTEDRVPHHGHDSSYFLNEALAEHERRKHIQHSKSNGVGGYHQKLGGSPVQNGKPPTVMLQQDDNCDLDNLESTDI